jgi:tetratricopeptide (TPR) repeat protein
LNEVLEKSGHNNAKETIRLFCYGIAPIHLIKKVFSYYTLTEIFLTKSDFLTYLKEKFLEIEEELEKIKEASGVDLSINGIGKDGLVGYNLADLYKWYVKEQELGEENKAIEVFDKALEIFFDYRFRLLKNLMKFVSWGRLFGYVVNYKWNKLVDFNKVNEKIYLYGLGGNPKPIISGQSDQLFNEIAKINRRLFGIYTQKLDSIKLIGYDITVPQYLPKDLYEEYGIKFSKSVISEIYTILYEVLAKTISKIGRRNLFKTLLEKILGRKILIELSSY